VAELMELFRQIKELRTKIDQATSVDEVNRLGEELAKAQADLRDLALSEMRHANGAGARRSAGSSATTAP